MPAGRPRSQPSGSRSGGVCVLSLPAAVSLGKSISFQSGHSHARLGPVLCKHPISKQDHVHRSWGLQVQHVRLGGYHHSWRTQDPDLREQSHVQGISTPDTLGGEVLKGPQVWGASCLPLRRQHLEGQQTPATSQSTGPTAAS